jgi:hypothetical protein
MQPCLGAPANVLPHRQHFDRAAAILTSRTGASPEYPDGHPLMFAPVVVILLVLVGFAPISVHAETCVSSTSTVRGEIRVVHSRHPNGTKIEAFQLVFRPPICVAVPTIGGQDRLETLKVREMHLFLDKSLKDRLRKRLGSIVTARGKIEEPLTAWHIGDAIMLEPTILDIED